MPRIARVVIPGIPHHVVQRGTRRMRTFFKDSDYRTYLNLLAKRTAENDVRIWGYALMPNHVHLIAVPGTSGGLRSAIGETHRRYTNLINRREGWTGYLWQGRFSSCPMDERHFVNAAKYLELNPVRAGLVGNPEDYPWSSARAHLQMRSDRLVEVKPLLDIAGDWRRHLGEPLCEKAVEDLRRSEKTGRPLGSEEFLAHLESLTGRQLRKRKAGRPSKGEREIGIVSRFSRFSSGPSAGSSAGAWPRS